MGCLPLDGSQQPCKANGRKRNLDRQGPPISRVHISITSSEGLVLNVGASHGALQDSRTSHVLTSIG
jgi:hypothetical protein